VALGIAVVVMAGAVVVALNTGQAVAGTPTAGDRPPPQPGCAGEDELVVSGSSLAYEAVTRLTAGYEAACPGKSVSYSPSGQGAGIQDFISGTTGMAVTDRPLDAGVAIPGVPITVVSRADESGATAVLQQYLAAVGGWTGGTGTTFTGQFSQTARGNEGTMAAVESIEGAVGYVLAGADWESPGMRISGVAPGLDAMARTISAALPDDGLVFDPAELYRAAPADGAYPLVSVGYAVACADSPAVNDFVLSSLSAQGGETAYLFPTGKWADRLADVLQ